MDINTHSYYMEAPLWTFHKTTSRERRFVISDGFCGSDDGVDNISFLIVISWHQYPLRFFLWISFHCLVLSGGKTISLYSGTSQLYMSSMDMIVQAAATSN